MGSLDRERLEELGRAARQAERWHLPAVPVPPADLRALVDDATHLQRCEEQLARARRARPV